MLGVLEVFGATLALIWVLVIGRSPGVSVTAVACCAAGAYAIGFSVLIWARQPSLWTIELLLAFTIVALISPAAHFAGPQGSALFSLFYVLAALYAFSFLGRRRAMAQGALIALAYALVLVGAGHGLSVASAVTSWLFVVGISFCSGLLVLVLSEGLQRSERRYRQTFERNPQPMWIHDADTRQFLDVNQQAIEFYGYSRAEFLAMRAQDICAPDAPASDTSLDGEEAYTGEIVRHVKKSGEIVEAEIIADDFDLAGRSAQLVLAKDVTARLKAERLLRRQADHDPLTGLVNRQCLERELDAMLERRADGQPCALIVVGIDHFKLVNDSFGHAHGDKLVRHIAQVLSRALGEGHVLGRFAGDEFAVAMPNATEAKACELAQDLLRHVREDVVEGKHHITASAGVAAVSGDRDASPDGRVSAEDLLIAADIALYQAKDAGRDRFAVAGDIKRGHTWIDEVRDALYDDRLVLYAQPIIDLASGETVREELLIRMVTPNGEVIPPASFIPAAERFGLIGEIDRWVVAQALDLARTGRALEVNLSGRSFGDTEITRMVTEAVAQGLDPANIVFEVTETAAASNYRESAEFAERLSRSGCGLALDDFGTGFGALSYLKHVPFNYLKIDTEFVRTLTRESRSQRIIKVIVRTARELGQKTIAEGVEDAAVIPILQGLGVDMAQGYHIAKPAPIVRTQTKPPVLHPASR